MKKIDITGFHSRRIAFAAFVLAMCIVAVPVGGKLTPLLAHAQCDGDCGGDSTSFYPDSTSFYPDSTSYYPDSTSYYPDTTTYTPDTSTYTPDTSTYYPDTNTSAYYPDTGSVYSQLPSSVYSSVYSSLPASVYSYLPHQSVYSGITPVITTPSNTSVYSPTIVANNGNSCTAGDSCNTTYNGGNTTVTVSNPPAVINNNNVTSAPPVQYYPQPTYYPPTPVCNTCGCNGVYCPQTVNYNTPNTPYVTLSQVPYTGLDLGPFGTVMYWSLLVLVSLFGAYLIVVKRAHRTIARSAHVFLFGSDDNEEATDQGLPVVQIVQAPVTVTRSTDVTDEFILSQIRRA